MATGPTCGPTRTSPDPSFVTSKLTSLNAESFGVKAPKIRTVGQVRGKMPGCVCTVSENEGPALGPIFPNPDLSAGKVRPAGIWYAWRLPVEHDGDSDMTGR